MTDEPQRRKLIEVSLPLEAINRESAREKSIRHGHPSTLHLWWARRPLAAARAVLFAQLVDDPSSHPDQFPTEEAQVEERERLHRLIERLVVWENVRDEELFSEAHEEILKSTDGNPPPILDPFAGGGSIPLEAQRLGLEAHASDLNPVAVLINKALIEIPPKFADRPPVFPGLAETELAGWSGAAGLAADVRAYGKWMRDEAEKRIGHYYPKATLPDGSEANVIAWIWARTVTCPNPACGIEMPLVRSWWLGKKKGKEAYVVPRVVDDPEHPSGKRVEFGIEHDPAKAPTKDEDGTVNRNGARCVACGSVTPLEYVRKQGRAGCMDVEMLALVAEGDRRREYLRATDEQSGHAFAVPDVDPLTGELPQQALGFRVQRYGAEQWADLFTDRQLLCLSTFSDLVIEAGEHVSRDTLISHGSLHDPGSQATESAAEYATSLMLLLGLAVSRLANRCSSQCFWAPNGETVEQVFSRNALPMVWAYSEANPFSGATGNFVGQVGYLAAALERTPAAGVADVRQLSAVDRDDLSGQVISTDPPYYDNVAYADLSDFFYVWLRRSLRQVFPELLGTMLVPKSEELIANPYRNGTKDGARQHFERGFSEVFNRIRAGAVDLFPTTVYYAFKQADVDEEGEVSTGWETLLDGMIHNGWSIEATWPLRTEMPGGLRVLSRNALASSVVLALRPRPDDAPTIDRRGLIEALQAELPGRLRELQQGRIAPVDLPQAAIGPGMAVFSRYSSVIEPDGSKMPVRSALARINEILDQVLNEQEGDFDPTTRFAISWYRQHGYERGGFGDANSLANARNTSVDAMAGSGILTSGGGKVALIAPAALEPDYDPATDLQISAWEVLHHMIRVVESEGIAIAGELLNAAGARANDPVDADLVKELAFLLFSIAEKSGWTQDALAFNRLALSWPDIVDAAREGATSQEQQGSFDL